MREMKDSGVEWIGNIPEKWKVCRFKHTASLYTGNSISDSEKDNYMDAMDAVPYITTKDINSDFSTIDYENGLYTKKNDRNFKIAKQGSSIMCIEGGSAGRKKAFTNRDISFVNKLCCFSATGCYEKYLYYFICSPNYESEFRNNLNGLIGGVSVSSLNNFAMLLPPADIQYRIADYLDVKCEQIDRAIARQQEVIEKLKEYKLSVITEAVTKGLNPDVPMKDSGIELLGEIPTHWTFQRLGDLCSRSITYGIVKLGEEDNYGVKVLRCSDVQPGFINESNIRTVAKTLSDEYSRSILQLGDVVVNVRGTLGGCAVISERQIGFNIAREVAIVPVSLANNRYIMYCLLSMVFSSYQKFSLRGVVYVGLNINLLSRYLVQLPPEDEQVSISDYLDKKCERIDEIAMKKQTIIAKLEEYKKSLIYEVVTGKREV